MYLYRKWILHKKILNLQVRPASKLRRDGLNYLYLGHDAAHATWTIRHPLRTGLRYICLILRIPIGRTRCLTDATAMLPALALKGNLGIHKSLSTTRTIANCLRTVLDVSMQPSIQNPTWRAFGMAVFPYMIFHSRYILFCVDLEYIFLDDWIISDFASAALFLLGVSQFVPGKNTLCDATHLPQSLDK